MSEFGRWLFSNLPGGAVGSVLGLVGGLWWWHEKAGRHCSFVLPSPFGGTYEQPYTCLMVLGGSWTSNVGFATFCAGVGAVAGVLVWGVGQLMRDDRRDAPS